MIQIKILNDLIYFQNLKPFENNYENLLDMEALIYVQAKDYLLKRFNGKVSNGFKNAGDEAAGKSANYNLTFVEPKKSEQNGFGI